MQANILHHFPLFEEFFLAFSQCVSRGGTSNESEVERAIIFPSRGSVDASRCSLTLARVKQRLNFPAVVNVNNSNNKLSADVATFKKEIHFDEKYFRPFSLCLCVI